MESLRVMNLANNKPLTSRASIAGLVLLSMGLVAGCDDSDSSKVADALNQDIDISGTASASGGAPLGTVAVSVLNLANDASIDTGTTDSAGAYTVKGIKDTESYVEYTRSGYASALSRVIDQDSNLAGLDVVMYTTAEAEAAIDTAFGGMALNLADKGWLVVDVENSGGEVNGATVAVTAAPDGGGSTNCDGTLTGTNVTSAPPCSPARTGPMYLAYYDDNTIDVTVTVGSTTYKAPVRKGEVTYVLVQQ